MQEASRQLFEMVDAEYTEEQRIASLNQEELEEGVPPSPQQRILPTEPVDPPSSRTEEDPQPFVCHCHEIDWLTPLKNGGETAYNYTDGTPNIQCIPVEGHGMPCGDRVNLGHISVDEVATNCRYFSWDDPNTKMPQDFIDFMIKWNREDQYDSRFDINHPDHYLNHYQSLQELMNHLQDPSLYDFPPIQGTNDVFQAQMDINVIEALKQESLESQQA